MLRNKQCNLIYAIGLYIPLARVQISQDITLQNGTEVLVSEAEIYELDFSFSINNFYNSSNLMMYVNNVSVSTLLSSFANGNYSTHRIIRLGIDDIVQIDTTITRIFFNAGMFFTLVKIDD